MTCEVDVMYWIPCVPGKEDIRRLIDAPSLFQWDCWSLSAFVPPCSTPSFYRKAAYSGFLYRLLTSPHLLILPPFMISSESTRFSVSPGVTPSDCVP